MTATKTKEKEKDTPKAKRGPGRPRTKKVDDEQRMSEIVEVHRFVRLLTAPNMYSFHTEQNGVLWYFKPNTDGIWHDNADPFIRSFVGTSLKGNNRYRSRVVNEVVKAMKDTHYHPTWRLGHATNIIVVENGRVDVANGRYYSSECRDELHITKIPVTYVADTTCPTFDTFIREIIDSEDDILAIEEFFGYCLYKGYPIAIIPILLGGGANGKSTLLGVLRALLGDDNITGSSIQELAVNKFRTARLFGKLANICGDVPSTTVTNSAKIKQLTGNDVVEAEKKGQEPFTFQNYAKLIFSANELPSTYDNSIAFYRRMRVIEFPHMFDVTDPKTDIDLLVKLTTKSEMSGVLNMAIRGLRRLLRDGMLTGEKPTLEKQYDYIKRSDSVRYFADKFVEQYTMGETPVSNFDMYDEYISVCKSLKMVPHGLKKFTGEMRRFLPYADFERLMVDGVRQSYWTGCIIRLDSIMYLEDKKGVN